MFTCNNLGSVLQADVQSQYSRNTGTVQALVWMIMICNIIDIKEISLKSALKRENRKLFFA